ncbi:MAG: pyruvate formate lyase family protein [Chloroflexota bacterium]
MVVETEIRSDHGPRVARLYERLWNGMLSKRQWWGGGLTVLDDPAVAAMPLIVRKAKAIEKVLREMPIRIAADELIVGEILMGGYLGHLFPDYAHPAEKAAAARRRMSVYSIFGHSAPDYAKLLRVGFAGLRAEAEAKLAAVAEADPTAPRQRAFLRAALVCGDAVVALARRYAELAAALAAEERDPQRRAELAEIAAGCARVPEQPARSFREALQSFWFTHLALNSTMTDASIGRFDYYLGPYLERDLAGGAITLSQARELVDCLWIKFNGRVQLRDEDKEFHKDPYAGTWMGTDPQNPDYLLGPVSHDVPSDERDKSTDNHWLQNLILSGMDPDGRDSTNALTYLCLEATGHFELAEPTVSVRLSPDYPEELLRGACEVMRGGGGMPALFNDRVLVEALRKFGFPAADALGYSDDGCWETLIPGKTHYHWGPVHGLKCLEYALNRGRSPLTGRHEGLDTGDPDTFSSFADLLGAVETQIDYQVRLFVESFARAYGGHYDIAPEPLLSLLVEGCLAQAKDITEGGAVYTFYAPLLTGLPHLADSLAAIQALVFEQKRMTLAELRAALASDWEGKETLRQLLLNRYPKYGNGCNEVDRLVKQLAHFFARRVAERAQAHPRFRFPPGLGAVGWLYLIHGKIVGATPDGRHARDAIAAGMTPGPGRDLEGPTAAVKSYTAVDFTELPSNGPLDLSMDPAAIKGENGLQRLIAFVRGFLEMGGAVLTVTVTDVETLRRAQREPEKYRGLRVRMGGWQAYFVALNREHQEHHIARVKHGLR